MSSTEKPSGNIGPSTHTIPDGDDRPRLTCLDCGYIAYDNPKVIVGAVCVWEDKFLMCRRAIEPRKGYWTIPAGYLELNETTADGAAREAWEEATAQIEITGLLGIYEIPRISQVYVIHKAVMSTLDFAAGPESEDVQLLTWEDIPWDDLAFPSVSWALERFREGSGPVIFEHPTT
ncbi:MAG: NUDIX hydrolase [Rhodospirillales bacterium]|mgnify:CR=1 FL=1|jgi:ADP-ribose pyrophosphatase YjhB (NUDIX family)|nr:NUDIX hydrolase [Rhodospirillales bacterium]